MLIPAIHALATWYLVGLIWFVQLVHYPLMAKVGQAGFVEYEKLHTKWTTLAVGPAMLAEALLAGYLLFAGDELGYPVPLAWLGFVLVVLIWGSTAVVQVPCHRKLEQGFDPATHRRLVASNWLRTAAWSARGVMVAWAMSG